MSNGLKNSFNFLTVFGLILLSVSVELLTDSCFCICKDEEVYRCLTINANTSCSDTSMIPLEDVRNTSISEDFDNCTECEAKNLQVGQCMCGGNVSCNITNNSTTTTAPSSSSSPCNSSNNPCHNGGSCMKHEDDDFNFTCNCLQGFEGPRCEESINSTDCNVTPCLNNGTCRNDSIGNHSICDCPEYFNGSRCEIDLCSTCLQDQTCIINSTTQEVQCATNTSVSPLDVLEFLTTASTDGITTEDNSTNEFTTKAIQLTSPESSSPQTTRTTTESSSSSPTTTESPSQTTHPTAIESTTTADLTTFANIVITTMSSQQDNETTILDPVDHEYIRRALIIGLCVGIVGFILLAAAIAGLVIYLKKSRATTGKYEPSKEEKEGTNIYFNILALPPEERLI